MNFKKNLCRLGLLHSYVNHKDLPKKTCKFCKKEKYVFFGMLAWLLYWLSLKPAGKERIWENFNRYLNIAEIAADEALEQQDAITEVRLERQGYELVWVDGTLKVFCNKKETCGKDKLLCGLACDSMYKLIYTKEGI